MPYICKESAVTLETFGSGEGGHTQTACEVSVECKYRVQS